MELPLDAARYALAAGAALVAGAVNAIAGGGSLITFPALLAGGLSAVTASATNTVALCPGYLGAVLAQRADLVGQGARARPLVIAGGAGGALGAVLLLRTGEAAFSTVVPYLLLFAASLLAVQGRVRRWLVARGGRGRGEAWAALPVGLAAIYGGYFGAGLGVILLAAAAVAIGDSLPRLNALKQAVSLAVNVAAAIVLAVAGPVDWPLAAVMLASSAAGGAAGGRLASRIPAEALRWTVVVGATGVAVVYLVR